MNDLSDSQNGEPFDTLKNHLSDTYTEQWSHLHIVLEVVNQEPHVCPELPDGPQLPCPVPELHQVSPGLLEGHLCPSEC